MVLWEPRLRKSRPWPDAAQSTGAELARLGRNTCWEAVGEARRIFNTLSKDIAEYTSRTSESLSQPVVWSCYMVGGTRGTSKPTITFISSEVEPRRRLKNLVRSSGILDNHPSFMTMDIDRPPECRSGIIVTLGEQQGTGIASKDFSAAYSSPYNDYLFNDSEEPHESTLDEMSRRSMVSSLPPCSSFDTAGNYNSYIPASSGRICDLGALPEYGHNILYPEALLSHQTNESCNEDGSRNATCNGSDAPESCFITPQAIKMRPESSKILRYKRVRACAMDDVSMEVPAGLKMEESAEPSTGSDGLIHSCFPAEEPREAAVVTHTVFGPVTGRLLGTKSFIQPRGLSKAQQLWAVVLDGPIRRGICGAWVMDVSNVVAYGQIVAYSLEDGFAYVNPLGEVLDDLRCRFEGTWPLLYHGGEVKSDTAPLREWFQRNSYEPSPSMETKAQLPISPKSPHAQLRTDDSQGSGNALPSHSELFLFGSDDLSIYSPSRLDADALRIYSPSELDAIASNNASRILQCAWERQARHLREHFRDGLRMETDWNEVKARRAVSNSTHYSEMLYC